MTEDDLDDAIQALGMRVEYVDLPLPPPRIATASTCITAGRYACSGAWRRVYANA